MSKVNELCLQKNDFSFYYNRLVHCHVIAAVRLSVKLRPNLYELLIEVLNPEEDFGVRLAASSTLKLMIDDFQFNPEEFSPYLGRAFCLVFALLKEVKEYSAKVCSCLFLPQLYFILEKHFFN